MKINIIFSKLTKLTLFSFVTIILFPILLISEGSYETELREEIKNDLDQLNTFEAKINTDINKSEVNLDDVQKEFSEKQNLFDQLIETSKNTFDTSSKEITKKLEKEIKAKIDEKTKAIAQEGN
jgi:hypothetical protein